MKRNKLAIVLILFSSLTCFAITTSVTTGNLQYSVIYSPLKPRVGDLVSFNFIKDDPDASVDYVCGDFSYDDGSFEDHILCPTRGLNCKNGNSFPAMIGHKEWTSFHTFSNPGTYHLHFSTRSGDFAGCNPNGDDGFITIDLTVSP